MRKGEAQKGVGEWEVDLLGGWRRLRGFRGSLNWSQPPPSVEAQTRFN